MRIAVIGSGKIGSTASRLFAQAGHQVLIANRRGPQSLAQLVQELRPSAQAATAEQAARSAELVLVAIQRLIQPGTPPYNTDLTATQARELLQ
jgi:predicted dinucleotide-binding enzyme